MQHKKIVIFLLLAIIPCIPHRVHARTYTVARTIVLCVDTQEAAKNPFWYAAFEASEHDHLRALLTSDYTVEGTPVTDDGRPLTLPSRTYQQTLYSGTYSAPAKNQICRIYDIVSLRP